MQFQIPQFIDVESKLVGPLTLKQFLYLAGAGGASFAAYFMFNTFLWILVTLVAAPLGLALAFFKYNGQPLQKIIISAVSFLWQPRLYIWKREIEEKTLTFSEALGAEKKSLFEMSNIKKLMQDLMTKKQPIEKREKTISLTTEERLKQGYAAFKKTTGETKFAKKINY